MKYFWHAFLGLFSLGFIGLMAGIIIIVGVFNHYAKDLPDYNTLKDYDPATVTRIYASDGRLMAEFAEEKRVYVPIETIPDLVKNAFIAAEDKNFYEHTGVDTIAIARAMLRNIKNIGSGRRPEGASTITQQVAKNFLLTNEVSYERKIKEAILAHRMEKAMTKDQILELYMNEIYLGSRAYGVTAAALQYFSKSLSELTIGEAAYLAALPKAPNNYHPTRRYDAAVERRNWVIDRMAEEGFVELAQADLAKISPLVTNEQLAGTSVKAPYFAEEVRRDLAQRYGEDSLYSGGLVVRSTVDARLQEIAQDALRNGLEAYDQRHGYRGPFAHFDTLDNWRGRLGEITRPLEMLDEWSLAVVLETGATEAKIGFSTEEIPNGVLKLEDAKWARKYLDEGYAQGPEITAVSDAVAVGDVIMVSRLAKDGEENGESAKPSNEYALKQIPDVQGAIMAMDPHTGRVLAMQGGWKYKYGHSEFNRATQADRQPGSAFKPFIYMAALENGFTPATMVLDAPFVIEDRPGHFWSPTNYSDEYYGPTPIRVGVEKSRNLMTVRLADYLGMGLISEYAEKFGIHKDMPAMLSYSLGAGETRLINMVSAYAMIVNGGKRVQPAFIDRVQDKTGKTIYRNDQRPCEGCRPLIKWAGQGTPMPPDPREQVIDPRTAYQMTSILEGVIQRGTAVKLKSLGRPLAGKTGTTNESKDTWFMGFSPDLVVGVYIGFDDPRSMGKRETGSTVAAPVFGEFMEKALKNQPIIPFRTPPGMRNIQINAETGARAKPGDQYVIWESFIQGTEPNENAYVLGGQGITPSGNTSSSATSSGATGNTGTDIQTGTGGLY
jgi:penicillin-binding protein 1A